MVHLNHQMMFLFKDGRLGPFTDKTNDNISNDPTNGNVTV